MLTLFLILFPIVAATLILLLRGERIKQVALAAALYLYSLKIGRV